MKNKLLSALLAGILVFSLTSCGAPAVSSRTHHANAGPRTFCRKGQADFGHLGRKPGAGHEGDGRQVY